MRLTALVLVFSLTACGTDAVDNSPLVAATADAPQFPAVADDFCVAGQQIMATTDLVADNTVHATMAAFTKSKASVDDQTLTIHQYVHEASVLPFGGAGEAVIMPLTVSCKFKTGDRIASFRGTRSVGEEKTCADLNGRTVDTVLARLGGSNMPAFIFDADDEVFMGPQWLDPWPYQTARQGTEGRIHIRAKAMHISFSKLIPMPDRFKGVHYCHLITEAYVTALATGYLIAPGGD